MKIIAGHNLPDADDFGQSDPYVKIYVPNEIIPRKTKFIKNNLNPKWNEEFIIKIPNNNQQKLLLEVWDKDRMTSDDLLGTVEIFPSNIKNEEDIGIRYIDIPNQIYDLDHSRAQLFTYLMAEINRVSLISRRYKLEYFLEGIKLNNIYIFTNLLF